MLPATHPLCVSGYVVTLLGKILCYAVVAVAMDLIWGYAGILSLGHGLFFALGGYAFGMYLMRGIGRDGSYQSDLPDFMVFLDWKALPWFWWNSDSFLWSLFLVVAVPGLLAWIFGYFAFRSRIKGVYFSIITQALTYAAMLLFFRNETGFGGNNGFTDFKRILGHDITSPEMRSILLGLSALLLMGVLVLGRYLVTSKFGRVLAIPPRIAGLFIGYPRSIQAVRMDSVGHPVCLAARCTAQVGILNPSEMSPAIPRDRHWVAWAAAAPGGPVLGAFIVNLAQSFSRVLPESGCSSSAPVRGRDPVLPDGGWAWRASSGWPEGLDRT